MRNIIQIAGIRDEDEARMLAEAGTDWLGFPFGLPVHQEDLSHEEAARMIRRLPENVHAVAITYLQRATDIVRLCSRLGAKIVQLHSTIEQSELQRMKRLDPSLIVVKSLIVRNDNRDELLAQIVRQQDWVNAFITDTFDPQTGASGATGKIHDWSVSEFLVRSSRKPVLLAGGLNPENVREAILRVCPAGVDAHTGLEDSSGDKDPRKVQSFISEARAAFERIEQTPSRQQFP